MPEPLPPTRPRRPGQGEACLDRGGGAGRIPASPSAADLVGGGRPPHGPEPAPARSSRAERALDVARARPRAAVAAVPQPARDPR